MDRRELDAPVQKTGECDAEWTAYAETMDAKLAEAVRTMHESPAVWVAELRKLRELVAAERTVGATVECQA